MRAQIPPRSTSILIIYTYLDGAPLLSQGPWVRAWERSWRRNGWTPRLLTRRIAEQHPEFFPDLAKLHQWCALAMQKELGRYASIFTFNHSLVADSFGALETPRVGAPVIAMEQYSLDSVASKFGAPGWESAWLVSFEGLPIDELYHSGLPL